MTDQSCESHKACQSEQADCVSWKVDWFVVGGRVLLESVVQSQITPIIPFQEDLFSNLHVCFLFFQSAWMDLTSPT